MLNAAYLTFAALPGQMFVAPPMALIPLVAGIGILRRNIWSARGFAVFQLCGIVPVLILHLEVFTCLPHSDKIPMPSGKAKFDAQTAQYQALNKIYGTYFSPGKAPSRACMAVEWIPGDSLIEIVGSALVINPPTPPAGSWQ